MKIEITFQEGTPTDGGAWYICLTCNQEIIQAFWSKKYRGSEYGWKIGYEDNDIRFCGSEYITHYAPWPSYDLIETE